MKYSYKNTSAILALTLLLATSFTVAAESEEPVDIDSFGNVPSELTRNIELWYSEAKALVGEHRGAEFNGLSMRVTNTDDVRKRYSNWLRALLSGSPQYRYFVDSTRIDASIDRMVQSRTGMYLWGSRKEILINKDNLVEYATYMKDQYGFSLKEVTLSLLIHEMVHAADDDEFDMDRMYYQNVGGSLNLDILFEGHAQQQTERYCKIAGCSRVFNVEVQTTLLQAETDNDDYLYYREDNSYLKYGRGYLFFKSLWDRNPALVKSAMKNPPSSVFDYFNADMFPNSERNAAHIEVHKMLESFVSTSADPDVVKVPGSLGNDFSLPDDIDKRLSLVEWRLGHELASGELHLYSNDDLTTLTSTIRLHKFRSDTVGLSYAKKFFRKYTNAYKDETVQYSEMTVISTAPFAKEKTPHNSWSFSMSPPGAVTDSPVILTSIIAQGPFVFEIHRFTEPDLHIATLRKAEEYLSQYLAGFSERQAEALKQTRVYRNGYRGVTTGVSSFEETVAALGNRTRRPSFSKYVFPGEIEVTFKNRVIKTIIIENDDYVDINGIAIGSSEADVGMLEGIEKRFHESAVTDLTNGIVYWFDTEGRVWRIVLMAQAKLN